MFVYYVFIALICIEILNIIEMNQSETQEKVLELIGTKLFTKIELSKNIGVSLNTLNNRLRNSDWRQREINIVKDI